MTPLDHQQMENQVPSQLLDKDVHSLSEDFHGTMEDCQALIKRYNKLVTITRHLLREVSQLVTSEDLKPTDLASADAYYKKVEKGLSICLILGEAVHQEGPLDDMIGLYLLGAKQEAATIVANAQKQVADQVEDQGKLGEQLREKNEYVKALEEKVAKLEQQAVDAEESRPIGDTLERIRLEADEYVKTIIAEADRYSRKRKLIADDHVLFAQKEADEYASKRKQELRKEEERLAELAKRLQHQFEGKVDGVLTTISEYVSVETLEID